MPRLSKRVPRKSEFKKQWLNIRLPTLLSDAFPTDHVVYYSITQTKYINK